MIEDQPSRTAQRVALRRAAHQLWDHPRVFDDPVALKIIGVDEAENLARSQPADTGAGQYLRAFITARSRYAEDQLAHAVIRGTRQYVVLGAGLDTFACRNPFAGLHVFEVDHPATQAWKRKQLESVGIAVPASLAFVPIDFEKQTLAQALELSGFKADQPAFFSWLGVTPYLVNETALAILRWVISVCSSNGIVFDYVVPRSSLGPLSRVAFDLLANRVAAAGEPFVGFFAPLELARDLRNMGFAFIEDLDAEKINERYFTGRSDHLRVAGAGRLLCARGPQAKTP
ncbi:MAG TPA: class I SAM-dependent methyltransferase [Candidatus Angelobacter sp.]